MIRATPVRRLLASVGLAFTVSVTASAQPSLNPDMAPPAGAPDPLPAVLRVIDLPYLSGEERIERRVFHGLWTEADLESTETLARAALIAGGYAHPVFGREGVPALLRAQSLVRSGELINAIELLEGIDSNEARVLLAESLERLGEFDRAREALQPVLADLARADRVSDAQGIVAGVRALRLQAKLDGRPASEYNRMIGLLSKVHQQIDRLYWPALLLEAELLLERGNRESGIEVLQQVLAINPMVAEAWRLLGDTQVDGLNVDGAASVARRLDLNVERIAPDRAMPSLDAELIRARRWMRENDPDRAASFLARARAWYPRSRDVAALHAGVEAMSYDTARTERAIEAFAQLSPGSPLALLRVGESLSERRQYAEAAEYLRRAIAMQPNDPRGHAELGLLLVQAARDAEAYEALSRAQQLDPFNVRVANSIKLLEDLRTWETIESDNFLVRFRPGMDAVLAREMIEPIESVHADLVDIYDHQPEFKAVLELAPDNQWFAVRIVGMPGIHTVAAATGPLIAMEVPRVGKRNMGEYDWLRVFRHEYAHTITLSKTRNRIPHWFTEAAAVYSEEAPRDFSRAQLLTQALLNGTLFDMREINLAFTRTDSRPQAYAQGHWMYEFIASEWGESAPLQLMEAYASGEREDAAMTEVLGISQQEFFERFQKWAYRDAASWGMVSEPSLRQLRIAESMQDIELEEAVSQSLAEFASKAALRVTGGAASPDFQPRLIRITPDLVEYWLLDHPDHPDLLELYLQEQITINGGVIDERLIELLERYAAARPVDPMPHQNLARLYLDSDEPWRAIPHLEFLDARENYSAAYASRLARLHTARGNREKAFEYATRATRVAPFDATNREIAAAASIQAGELREAERHILALTEIEPDREQHRLRLDAVRRLIEERAGRTSAN